MDEHAGRGHRLLRVLLIGAPSLVLAARSVMMTSMSMKPEELQIGDTLVDGDGNVIYTIVWEPVVDERGPVMIRVKWALDDGQTDRVLPYGVENPNLVRPTP